MPEKIKSIPFACKNSVFDCLFYFLPDQSKMLQHKTNHKMSCFRDKEERPLVKYAGSSVFLAKTITLNL
ncbi:MAG: hypothetical protein DSY58_07535 [Desulfobulbus sp.]|nr:MAG: hypothetical protein DSY58_07535 [Desulfobulbus sp.]